MRSDGAIFSDLIGQLDVSRVACTKCERAGRYRLESKTVAATCAKPRRVRTADFLVIASAASKVGASELV
jgi:hypothetical protein